MDKMNKLSKIETVNVKHGFMTIPYIAIVTALKNQIKNHNQGHVISFLLD